MAKWMHVEAALLCGGLVLGAASLAAAQQLPTPGVTGTIAPDPAIDQEQAAAHTAIAKMVDGIKHGVQLPRARRQRDRRRRTARSP